MKRIAFLVALVLLGLAAIIWVVNHKIRPAIQVTLGAPVPLRDAKGNVLHFDEHPDQPKAMQITCVNNMKQIGLDMRLWSADHGDKFPFNVSTNAGGTMELCAANAEGFDSNSIAHFRAMTDELGSPIILFCPQDRSKKVVTNWANLRPANVTYRLRVGTNVDETRPTEILLMCPVDGNILRCNGEVTQRGQPISR